MIQNFLPREARLSEIREGLASSPIVAVLGPRQCGKTTLAGALRSGQATKFYDLEEPSDLFQLETGSDFLARADGLVVIDEIQRLPSLFPRLRVWADREYPRLQFLITGSASFELIRGVSESLAGRVRFVRLTGFDLSETGAELMNLLWLRGGFPKALLARTAGESWLWRRDFVDTFLTRDLPQLQPIRHPAALLRRFWTMLAHYHGQTWNAHQVAASLGIDQATVNRYLHLMVDAFMVRLLPPWTENASKRVRKAPKLYLRDSGVAHYLLNLRTEDDLLSHPGCGASWEGFVIEQIMRYIDDENIAYYWSTHGGAEVDLMLELGSKRIGFEVKRNSNPSSTKSMRSAISDLKLAKLYIVYPGDRMFAIDDIIEVLPLTKLGTVLESLSH